MEKPTVIVIGAGPAGLAALKALIDEGFDVTCYERRDAVGGVWSLSDNSSYTSTLPNTVTNSSRFTSHLSDFPTPKDWPSYLSPSMLQSFYHTYAQHFHLMDHIVFNVTTNKVVRNTSQNKWDVYFKGPQGESIASFDKVVFSHGANHIPIWPSTPGRENFSGLVMHSQSFNYSPAMWEKFKDKRVLLVGLGNTSADIGLSLINHASKVYVSHRRGRLILPRCFGSGLPSDTTMTWVITCTKYFMDYMFPSLAEMLLDKTVTSIMIDTAAKAQVGSTPAEKRKTAEKRLREEWHFLPASTMRYSNPVSNDEVLEAFTRKDIIPVPGFKAFNEDGGKGTRTVILDDSSDLEVDVVLFCTGYKNNFDLFPDLEMDGCGGLPLITAREMGKSPAKVPHLPRLYQSIFPPQWASSVAFTSYAASQENFPANAELTALAIAQIWAAETASTTTTTIPEGYRQPARLPSVREMEAQVDSWHTWWRSHWETDHSMQEGFLSTHHWFRFLHGAAGTGMYEHVDHMFSLRGWALWWRDRELYTWIAHGPKTNIAWRIFDTNPLGIPGCGRRTWSGAREALRESYEQWMQYKQKILSEKQKDD